LTVVEDVVLVEGALEVEVAVVPTDVVMFNIGGVVAVGGDLEVEMDTIVVVAVLVVEGVVVLLLHCGLVLPGAQTT
jgi:hypothetical protein